MGTKKTGIIFAALAIGLTKFANAKVGADIDWTSYEAEAMATNGEVLEVGYELCSIQAESSAQQCVRLREGGEFVGFNATVDANAMVIRFNLPDSPEGGGLESKIDVIVNGERVRTLELSSRNMLVYGTYPFPNNPAAGLPRNFYDEVRLKGLEIVEGDLVRIQKTETDGVPCVIDFVDLESIDGPLAAPDGAISILDYGAVGDGVVDDTQAMLDVLAAAREQGRAVYVPEGYFKLTRDIVLEDNDQIQGAGMWHTNFVGDVELYTQADRRVRFKLTGSDIHISDFAITGALNYRNDQEPNDGVIGAGCSDSSVKRIWIEHTKCGVWTYNGTRLLVEGCRFRNMLADGLNFCVGTTESVVENSSARGTGDDCFAIWPAASDQGFVDDFVIPGNNVIRRCTGALTFLANGASVYGGANNRVEDCSFVDIGTGCGILLSSTFPVSDDERGLDNNFSGTTVVRNVELLRCGGYDHASQWRGSFQICLDRKSFGGLAISGVSIRDSMSDGLTIIAPGSRNGVRALSDSFLESVSISNVGLGAPDSKELYVRGDASGELVLRDCAIAEVVNESNDFMVVRED